MKILLKELYIEHTATNIGKALGITRQAVWKSLNKLSKEKLILLKSIADTKKSAVRITLNFNNPITPKMLSLILSKELINYERWKFNFKELEPYVSFLILFGSILHSPKEADDIDVISVIDKKNNFKKIDEIISKIQRTQSKKIHLIDLTEDEFKKEIMNKNKAYLDALKKGIILFGDNNFIKFIGELRNYEN